ncbi:MAG: cytochrome C oxidase subunit IV family protein [Bdellovibrionales bacterium]
MAHVIQSAKTYNKVLGILLVLTVLTVIASQIHVSQAAHTFIALAIASAKAYFVASIFMNLKHSGPVNVGIFAVALFFLVLLYVISITDIFTRVAEVPVL